VLVHARHDAHPDRTSNGLCEAALVARPQPRDLAVLDAAGFGHEFVEQGEVLWCV
jgi:hypothetical protein